MPIMFVDLIIIFVTYLSAAETGQAYDSHGLFNDEETMQLLTRAQTMTVPVQGEVAAFGEEGMELGLVELS